MPKWFRDRSLTLVLLACFIAFTTGQIIAGWYEYNDTLIEHGEPTATLGSYFGTGHLWEAIFENWESEFLQMAVFVILTTVLVQRGSPESRQPGEKEPADADPREHRTARGAPWPVRRGGWILWVYERSLGIAFGLLFLFSLTGHAVAGWIDLSEDQRQHAASAPSFAGYLASSRFWFESMQNWQSEFLSIAAMVWLSVYLRQRGSPESKPVHVPHDKSE